MNAVLGPEVMAAKHRSEPTPIGPIVARNLYRLGHADIVVRSTDLSKLVREKTGKSMSRQRIAAIVQAMHLEPETIATLAEAVGVDPAELTRR